MVIYKTTNAINGKIYVGKDVYNDPDYYGSGKIYKQAEKKYGKENFRKAIIDFGENKVDLCLKEIFWIDFYDARNPAVGYNIAKGGEGWPSFQGKKHSEETLQKMRMSKIGKSRSEETKRKISITQIGRNHSRETKEKMSASRRGKRLGELHPMYGKSNPNAIAAMVLARLGKPLSEETKRKISVSEKETKRRIKS